MATISDLIDYIIMLRQEIVKRDQVIEQLREKDNKTGKNK